MGTHCTPVTQEYQQNLRKMQFRNSSKQVYTQWVWKRFLIFCCSLVWLMCTWRKTKVHILFLQRLTYMLNFTI